MINPIKHSTGLWISSEPSPESLLVKSYWLYMWIKQTWMWNSAQNWGAKQGVSQKSGKGMAHPGHPQNRHWVTPGQSTTSCLQLFGIFIMMQRTCYKQMIVSW